MMEGIIEAADLPEDKKVYLKWDNLINDYRTVYPNKKWYVMDKKDWIVLICTAVIAGCFYLGVNELIAANVAEAIKDCITIPIK